mgnify:CR=1 FL=1
MFESNVCLDCLNCDSCHNCMNCTDCDNCQSCANCSDCKYLSNCLNCHHFFGTKNNPLKYYVNNKKVSKRIYFKKVNVCLKQNKIISKFLEDNKEFSHVEYYESHKDLYVYYADDNLYLANNLRIANSINSYTPLSQTRRKLEILLNKLINIGK